MFAKVKGSFQMLVKFGQMLDKMRGAHSFQKKCLTRLTNSKSSTIFDKLYCQICPKLEKHAHFANVVRLT